MKQLVGIVEISGIHADGGRIREKTCPLMTRNASPLGLAVQPAVRTTSSERNAAMFAQIASMILRGIREFDEVARELEKDISSDGSQQTNSGQSTDAKTER